MIFQGGGGGGGKLTYIYNVFVCTAFVWFVIFCVLEKNLIHVCARILEQLIGTVKDDQRNLTVA